jgi:GTP cyclohydrolase I
MMTMNRREQIEEHVRGIMQLFDLDLTDESLKDTPKRVAKMFEADLFWGLKEEHIPSMTTQESKGYNEMLIETNITVNSLCEHHLVPIIGSAHIAYIPNDRILGLSKFNRIVDYFSRRPQVQEKLTKNIKDFLVKVLNTEDVAVVIDASHMCVRMRGIRDRASITRTNMLGGRFMAGEVRAELFASLPKPSDLQL